MRFGAIHRFLLTLLSTFGVLAMMCLGATSLATNVLLLLGLVAVWFVPETFWHTRPWLRGTFNIGFLVLFFLELARWIAGAHVLDLTIEFLAVFQVLRLLTRRGAAHDILLLGIATLQFTAGAILGGGLGYAICFLGFVIVAPAALVLSHLRREVEGNYRQGARDRTGLPVDVPRILRSRRVVGRGFLTAMGLLSLPILVAMGALFLLFPRVGLSLLFLGERPGTGVVGFSDHVDLGQVGALRLDPSLSIRFTPENLPADPPARLPLRLRGTAYDTYDGKAWSRSLQTRHALERVGDTLLLQRFPSSSDRRILFEVEPMEPPIVFLPFGAVSLEPIVPIGESVAFQRGSESEVRYVSPLARGVRYGVLMPAVAEIPTEPLATADRSRYLTMPANLSPRVRALAHEWTVGKQSQLEIARTLEEHLKTNFTYDLRAPSSGMPQPVEHFLFESKRGHCEFFSTSLALLLREDGIPSRTVNGFVGGEYNRFGQYYAVRRSNAHSWVEAFIDEPSIPGFGHWMIFDPTPPSGVAPVESQKTVAYLRDAYEAIAERWQRNVVRYNLETQIRAVHWIGKKTAFLRNEDGESLFGFGDREKFFALVIVVAAFGAWGFTRRRRFSLRGSSKDVMATRPERLAGLSGALERTLSAIGHPRPPNVPPLRHAELLSHPKKDDVLALTQIYLEARFGGVELTDEDTQDFYRRASEIRSAKAAPASETT